MVMQIKIMLLLFPLWPPCSLISFRFGWVLPLLNFFLSRRLTFSHIPSDNHVLPSWHIYFNSNMWAPCEGYIRNTMTRMYTWHVTFDKSHNGSCMWPILWQCSVNEVRRLLLKLKPHKSPGAWAWQYQLRFERMFIGTGTFTGKS